MLAFPRVLRFNCVRTSVSDGNYRSRPPNSRRKNKILYSSFFLGALLLRSVGGSFAHFLKRLLIYSQEIMVFNLFASRFLRSMAPIPYRGPIKIIWTFRCPRSHLSPLSFLFPCRETIQISPRIKNDLFFERCSILKHSHFSRLFLLPL